MSDTRPDEECCEAQGAETEEQPEVLTVEVEPDPEPAPVVVLKANGRPAGYGRPGK